MSCRQLRTVFRPASVLLIVVVLLWGATKAAAVTRPSMSEVAPVVTDEPVRIVPTPLPIASARPFRHYEGSLSDLEVGLFDDAIDSKWDTHTLLEAALIAGGVRDATELEESVARFDRFVEQFGGSINRDTKAEELVRTLFDFMHREILVGGYELECTDLAETLSTGQFNCVSSTVVFNCLASRFGFEAVGMELPGHAMSRVHLAGEAVDVETTCPSWFRLQHDPKRRAALIAKTIGADAHAAGSGHGREVSPVELVAMIYYNRGVDLLMDQQFAEAAAANAKALRLDPSSETARGNLLATLNNWAITIGACGKYEEAIDLLERGMDLDPAYETFTANYIHLYYQWAEALCGRAEFESALTTLGRVDPERFGTDRLSQLRLGVCRRWARQLLQQGDSLQAAQLLRMAEAADRPVDELLSQIENEALVEGTERMSGRDALDETDGRTDGALDLQPQSKLLGVR